MENKFTKFTKYILGTHVILFIITIVYMLIVNIIVNYFYMYDARRPWQTTFLNTPLTILIYIQILLYWTKFFLFLSLIALVFYRSNVTRIFYVYLLATILICILIEFNVIHVFFNFILQGYDFDGATLKGGGKHF
jgi:hypothetical protein